MKTIILHNYTKEKNGFSVYLGNGTVSQFSNLKDTKQFLAVTSKELTKIWTELWNIHKHSSQSFENYFPLLLVSKKGGNGNLLGYDRKLQQNISQSITIFNDVIWKCGWTNGNYLAFHFLSVISDMELDNLKMLAEIARQKNFHHDLGTYDFSAERIVNVQNRLASYSRVTAKALFDVPKHFDFSDREKAPLYRPKLRIAI